MVGGAKFITPCDFFRAASLLPPPSVVNAAMISVDNLFFVAFLDRLSIVTARKSTRPRVIEGSMCTKTSNVGDPEDRKSPHRAHN